MGRRHHLSAQLLGVGVRRLHPPTRTCGGSWGGNLHRLYTDLAAGALEMAVWQRKRAGADLMGLVHHLRPWGAGGPIRYGQALSDYDTIASVGSQGRPPFGFALAEALNSLL